MDEMACEEANSCSGGRTVAKIGKHVRIGSIYQSDCIHPPRPGVASMASARAGRRKPGPSFRRQGDGGTRDALPAPRQTGPNNLFFVSPFGGPDGRKRHGAGLCACGQAAPSERDSRPVPSSRVVYKEEKKGNIRRYEGEKQALRGAVREGVERPLRHVSRTMVFHPG